ncbi:MAG: hypothetical protein JST12_10910 [Armatimonadetes bacterium]|nr:hypothetical protein [Armatimonadota bacterium]MBS1725756.1 hypothetical protein [Armatimonadota bacterium]
MIPREIDELMWTIAEGGNSEAISEFGDRYPNLREELLKRIRTVNALKSGGRSVPSGKVPTFNNTRVQPFNWRIVFATLGLTILVMASYGLWRATSHPQSAPVVPPVNVNEPQLPQANIAIQPGSAEPQPRPKNNAPINSPVVPNVEPDIPAQQATSVKLESATLHAAITLIAEAGGMKVTIAPGTPNPTVKIDFEDMTPLDMLKKLGQDYAFNTLMDGDHAILVIPKKDEDDELMTNETR